MNKISKTTVIILIIAWLVLGWMVYMSLSTFTG